MRMHSPAHPGAILAAYMGESLTISALSRHLGMTRANLSMILNGRLGVTAAVAVKLSESFPQSDPVFWLNLQAQYDIAKVLKLKRKAVKPVFASVA